jgi:hypothetical protein
LAKKKTAANEAYQKAFSMPEGTSEEKKAKAAAFDNAAAKLKMHANDDSLAKAKYDQSNEESKKLYLAAANQKVAESTPKTPTGGVNTDSVPEPDAIINTLDHIEENGSPAPAFKWDDYLSASLAYKKNPTQANLKKLTAAQSALTDEGVTPADMQSANSHLFKQLGMTKTAKKTAAKKVAQKAPAPAPKAPAAPTPPINLPGPGMYADGKAIKAAEDKLAKMDKSDPRYAGLNDAINNAKIEFKNKHGNNYAGDKAGQEVRYTGGYGGGYDAGVKDDFFSDAKAAGYATVPSGQSANGSWKPSDVPGLASNAGGYHYSGGAYSSINAQLRKHKKATGGSNDKAIAQMDKEFAAVPPLDHGIVTIRQMSTDGPFPGYPPSMEAGSEFVDHGYSSTSKKTGTWSGDVVMEVRIPKGAKVLDLNHTTGSQHSGEQEILLNRGTKYKIVSDSKSKYGERKIVVEVVA